MMAKKKQHFRHQNGFGSIVKLSGNRRKPYAVRITTGWKDGKQIRKYLGYYDSQQEALVALADYHKQGYNIDLNKLTLSEVYDRWISRIEDKVSKNVLNSHNMARVRFEQLGNVPIKNIKTDQLQDWMDNIDLKPGSKKRVKSTLTQLFNYAISNDIVSNNYANNIVILDKTEKTGKIFTDDEIQTLWDNVNNPTAKWVLILIYTGMRIGELLDITTDNVYLDKHYMIGGNKTEAGKDRVIPIHNKILPMIKEQLGDEKYLMHDKRGRKMTYWTALNHFDLLMAEMKWEHKPHDARKTGVSIMHKYGIPMETIRVIVGHSGKGVTETVYLHHTPEELVKAINKIEIV
jgi:integrase